MNLRGGGGGEAFYFESDSSRAIFQISKFKNREQIPKEFIGRRPPRLKTSQAAEPIELRGGCRIGFQAGRIAQWMTENSLYFF